MNFRTILFPSLLIIIIVITISFGLFYIIYIQHGNELKVGSNVPEFVLPDQNGKEFDLKNVIGKKNLVIYFYPKDETPGCTLAVNRKHKFVNC